MNHPLFFDKEHILKRLDDSDKDSLIEPLGYMLNSNDGDSNLKQISSKQKLKLLPFRKIKFSSKLV